MSELWGPADDGAGRPPGGRGAAVGASATVAADNAVPAALPNGVRPRPEPGGARRARTRAERGAVTAVGPASRASSVLTRVGRHVPGLVPAAGLDPGRARRHPGRGTQGAEVRRIPGGMSAARAELPGDRGGCGLGAFTPG